MSEWLNNKTPIHEVGVYSKFGIGKYKNGKNRFYKYMVEKPCHKLGFCPYGQLVEEFPIQHPEITKKGMPCETFGHDCPVFYLAEPMTE